jgi:hypothetical protein
LLLHQVHFFATPALYMDPGTGSLLLQLILAALLGIGVTVRIFWKKIRGWFGAKNPETMDITEDDDEE